MKNQTRRAAVVGLGIGLGHAAGYLSSPHAELVAVADSWDVRRAKVGGTFSQGSMLNLRPLLDPDILEKKWEDLGIAVYEDVARVAEDPGIDLVSLCTPDDTHEEYACLLLGAGKDLVLEKPVALSLESATRIAEAARRSGCRVAVNFEMRVNPAVQKLRELVGSGMLGDIQAFNLQQHRAPFRRDKWQKWIQSATRSGGLIVEETCHWFDLARYLTGDELATVHAVSTDRVLPDFDFEDIAYVQGRFVSGAILQVGHALTGFDFSIIIQIHGTLGSAWCALKADRHSALDGGQTDYLGIVSWGPADPVAAPGQNRAGGTARGTAIYGEEALEGENIMAHVAHCVESLVTNRPFVVDLEDGIQALKMALAARASTLTASVEEVQ
jgi:predicted dehydrogenase